MCVCNKGRQVDTYCVSPHLPFWNLLICHLCRCPNQNVVVAPNMQRRQNEFESGEKFFSWSCPSTFLALQVGLQLVVLVNAFVIVSTVWSVSCLLFFYWRYPRAQPFVKLGRGTCPPLPQRALLSRRQLLLVCFCVCAGLATLTRRICRAWRKSWRRRESRLTNHRRHRRRRRRLNPPRQPEVPEAPLLSRHRMCPPAHPLWLSPQPVTWPLPRPLVSPRLTTTPRSVTWPPRPIPWAFILSLAGYPGHRRMRQSTVHPLTLQPLVASRHLHQLLICEQAPVATHHHTICMGTQLPCKAHTLSV